jgi:hypothetical protein
MVIQLNSSFGQSWFKTYSDNYVKLTNKIIENYDRGYVISGHCFALPGYHYYGYILKLDINGNKLWTKYCGDENSWSAFGGCRLLLDGGSIYSGNTYEYFGKMNPLVVKLNSCGEKEWCKIYSSSLPYVGADQIESIPGGGYILSLSSWLNQNDIWLFRLDSIGDIIWAQQFVSDSAIFWDPFPRSLIRTSDSCFLLNGEAYSPDSLHPGYLLLKIFSVKCDLNGSAIFQEPWGNNDGLVSDYDFSNLEDKNHTYFVSGRLARAEPPYGDSPTIFHITSTGKKDYFKALISSSLTGGATTINRFQDSSLVMSAGWSYGSGTDTFGIIKTNPVGDVLKTKLIVANNPDASLWAATVTNDNKFIATGELNSMTTIVVKLNSELEYDSIYSQSFTYDSLCPYPIVSDTIPLNDCGVVTSVFDPVKDIEKTYLKVFPNPSSSKIYIEMPDFLIRKSKGCGFSANTFYYTWDKAKIVIYDLNGTLIYSENLLQKEKEITLDVNNLHDGMYVVHLLYLNDVVAQAKFLVQK